MDITKRSLYPADVVLSTLNAIENGDALTELQSEIDPLIGSFPKAADHDGNIANGTGNVVFAAAPVDPISPTIVSELLAPLFELMGEFEQPTANQQAEVIGRWLVNPDRKYATIFTGPELRLMHSSDVWKLWCMAVKDEELIFRCNNLRELWPDLPVGLTAIECKMFVYQKLGGI